MTAESMFKEMISIIGIFFGLVWYLCSGIW
jgi:hypothetical protein